MTGTPSGPVAGTAGAQAAPARQATEWHAAAASPSAATGSLSTVLKESVHGDYTAAGTGMRNLGYGTISITSIPAGATVKSATLLWDILADSADPSYAEGSLNGTALTGTLWASGASPCWAPGSNFSYEADVTSLVAGNGSFNLTGFATGENDGADPWTSGSAAPMDEGASLVVVYKLASMPENTIQIAAGATETQDGNTASATFDGFSVGAETAASTTYIVADGQMAGNTAAFDGTTLPSVSFPGADPLAVANYSEGNLWDTVTTDVGSSLSPGDTSATIGVTGNSDCLVWVGQVLSVRTPVVLAFGDSVAAGYGLGPSQLHPDNPGAYSAILAKKLGYDGENYAVEGVCAGVGNGCPAHSVDWQIRQVPADVTPGLITLTVGADDINFGGCLVSIIQGGDESMKSSSDPCKAAELSRHLTDFKVKLANDLKTLHGKYPGVPIQVMDYYNPFPKAPAAKQSPCLFSVGAAFPYDHKQVGWLKTVERFIIHHSQFTHDARTVQGLLYKDAQSVLNRLNAAINSAASGLATIVRTTDFAGHNICSHGSWVFAPTFTINASLKVGPVGGSIHKSILGREVCPDPVSPADKNFKVSGQFNIKKLHIKGSFNFATGLNCLPHPTLTGQTALANNFLNQGA